MCSRRSAEGFGDDWTIAVTTTGGDREQGPPHGAKLLKCVVEFPELRDDQGSECRTPAPQVMLANADDIGSLIEPETEALRPLDRSHLPHSPSRVLSIP
jgi:hypothetical protein